MTVLNTSAERRLYDKKLSLGTCLFWLHPSSSSSKPNDGLFGDFFSHTLDARQKDLHDQKLSGYRALHHHEINKYHLALPLNFLSFKFSLHSSQYHFTESKASVSRVGLDI